jgi:hypothetical protein
VLDYRAYLSMALVVDGVLDARRVNQVNVGGARVGSRSS